MLIIYRGSSPLLPLLACCVHFESDRDMVKRIQELETNWDWEFDPMKMIGADSAQNLVFCLVHGKYGAIYHRAITGVSDIFALETKVIDTDNFMTGNSYISEFVLWKSEFGETEKNKIMDVIKFNLRFGSR